MRILTTPISYKSKDGLYKMGEVFVYTSPKSAFKLIELDCNGFSNAISIHDVEQELHDYLYALFGVGYSKYYLIVRHGDNITIFQYDKKFNLCEGYPAKYFDSYFDDK